ncbi:MAG: hypothetical protein E6K34_17415 [Gammaproteobacteria bacterium]|nr:MAG: hypothetical protein E6K34_17415 [Gammaproteobacteria bacterium]
MGQNDWLRKTFSGLPAFAPLPLSHRLDRLDVGMSPAVQGGDTQDQNLLQFFLNVVEFGMTVQEATEAANITSYQMRDSFADHQSFPGRLALNTLTPPWVREQLTRMGYTLEFEERTSGPINAIFVDRKHGTLWGGSSNYGQDYGIGW